MRYLWVYSSGSEYYDRWHQRLLATRQAEGYDVTGFCITPPEFRRNWLHWPELEYLWRTGAAGLFDLYERLLTALADRDVLILYNGANLHPEFVRWLPVFKVYSAADDPESSEILSRPVANAFDLQLVNNIACVEQYRQWGCPRAEFWPLGSQVFPEDVADLTADQIADRTTRAVPILFLGERASPWRVERLEQLAKAFPQATCAGRGWPRGFVSDAELATLYRQAQLGWNIHNSTGPINFRTYDLAAHGVVQLCDNRQHLGQIYDLDREVAGFETIDECIDLTHQLLGDPQRQADLAVAAWQRWQRDYTPGKVWEQLVARVQQHAPGNLRPFTKSTEVRAQLAAHQRAAVWHFPQAVVRFWGPKVLRRLRRWSGL